MNHESVFLNKSTEMEGFPTKLEVVFPHWFATYDKNTVTAPVRGRVFLMMFQPSCLQDLLKTHAFCNSCLWKCKCDDLDSL